MTRDALFPLIYAHRGLAHEAPENSFAAFDAALAAGVDGFELDVRLTRDEVPVVFHDPDLRRMAGRPERIAELPFRELSAIPIRASGRPEGSWSRIPALGELLARYGGRTRLNIEIKPDHNWHPAIVDSVLDVLRAAPGGMERVQISSFNPFVLHRAATLEPDLARRLLVGVHSRPWTYRRPWLLQWVRAGGIHLPLALADAELVTHWRRRGYGVCVWTVNDLEHGRRLAAAGATELISDHPRRLAPLRYP
jgi:glycerophosphoryl diester phosphodiesterase